jgi:chloramphenicol 3-O phosphotransferase
MASAAIILLNGASSAGKSSIALKLQQQLDEPFLHVGLDHFLSMLPSRYFGREPGLNDPANEGFRWNVKRNGQERWVEITAGPIGHQLARGAHRAIAGLASAGNHLIVDEVLLYQEWLIDYLGLLQGVSVLFVGVHCPLPILEQRERKRERGYRMIGQARGQYELVHRHRLYDLVVDTSLASPEECAERIKRHLQEETAPHAFDQLRTVYVEQLEALHAAHM